MTTTRLPRGLTGELVFADQLAFDTPVMTGFKTTPFYSLTLAQSEGLPSDALIGGSRNNDRDTRAPAPDLATVGGQIVVPLDLRHLGYWLKGAFGAATVTAVAATGALEFASQPDAASTITVNGQAFTFVAADPGVNDIEIGANLAATITAVVAALNGSGVTGVAKATYDEEGGDTVTIEHDVGGPDGNAFTLAASAGSHATRSGATLAGGCYSHVFVSGGEVLPSRTLGIRKRVPAAGDPIWFRTIGAIVSMLRMQVSHEAGYARATLDMVGHSEAKVDPTAFGAPASAIDLDQVAAALGILKIDGTQAATLISAEGTYDNGLAALEFAKGDKHVAGYAPDNEAKWSGTLTARYADEDLYDQSVDGSAKSIEMVWAPSTIRSLSILAPACRLERFGIPLSGPGGIQAQVPFRAEQGAADAMLIVTLRNDVASY